MHHLRSLIIFVGLTALQISSATADEIQILSKSGNSLAAKSAEADQQFDVQVQLNSKKNPPTLLRLEGISNPKAVFSAPTNSDHVAVFGPLTAGKYFLSDIRPDAVRSVSIVPSSRRDKAAAVLSNSDGLPGAVYALGLGGVVGVIAAVSNGGSNDSDSPVFGPSIGGGGSSAGGGSSFGSGSGGGSGGFSTGGSGGGSDVGILTSPAPNPGAVSGAPGSTTVNGNPLVPSVGGPPPGSEPDIEAAPIPPSPTNPPAPSGS